MKTTIPKLRQIIRKVITESMSDTVRDLQDVMDVPRGPVGNRAMDKLYKREEEAGQMRRRQHAKKLAADEAAAEKFYVRLHLPSRFSQHYAEWKSWLDSLDLSGAEFIDKQYHNSRKEKPRYFHFKIDKQKALEIEAQGEALPETDYSLVSATARRADGIS